MYMVSNMSEGQLIYIVGGPIPEDEDVNITVSDDFGDTLIWPELQKGELGAKIYSSPPPNEYKYHVFRFNGATIAGFKVYEWSGELDTDYGYLRRRGRQDELKRYTGLRRREI